MIIEVQVKGPEDVARHIEAMAREYPDVAGRASWDEFSKVMNVMKSRVPRKTNFLWRSGVVAEPVVSGGMVLQKMGFYANYAEPVEKGQPHHTKAPYAGQEAHHSTGQSHFAEQTWKEMEPGLLDNIAQRIDAMIREAL